MVNAETLSRGDAEILENSLSEQVFDAGIEVHRTLGCPGLLESLYEDALFYGLRLRKIPALSQVQVSVTYRISNQFWTEASHRWMGESC